MQKSDKNRQEILAKKFLFLALKQHFKLQIAITRIYYPFTTHCDLYTPFCEKKKFSFKISCQIFKKFDQEIIWKYLLIFLTNSLVLIKIWLICAKCSLECFEIVMRLAVYVINWIFIFCWLNRKSRCLIKMIHLGMEYNVREQFWWN